MNIDFDSVRTGFLIQAKYLGCQLLLAHDSAGPCDQRLKHRLLAGGENQQFIAKGEAPGAQVVHQRSAPLLALPAQYSAPQQGFDPGLQLSQFEGFCQIIVSPQIEPVNPVPDIAAGSQHQYRQGLAPAAQTRQHLKTVHARQSHIQDRHCIFLAAQGQVGSHTVVQHIHGQTSAFQGLGNTLGQLQLIFDQKYTHRVYLIIFVQAGAFLCAECTDGRNTVKCENRERAMKGN